MSRSAKFSFVIVFVPFFALSDGNSMADAAAKNTKKNVFTPDENGCFKKLGMQGRPHRISAIASLSAVRLWSEAAKKYGEQYAMWHNAVGSGIKCDKLPRSDYYSCFASGKPCTSRTTP